MGCSSAAFADSDDFSGSNTRDGDAEMLLLVWVFLVAGAGVTSYMLRSNGLLERVGRVCGMSGSIWPAGAPASPNPLMG